VTVAGPLSPEEIDDLVLAASAAPLIVRVRIATPDRRLAAVLEPGVAPPRVRTATLRALRRAGLDAGLLVDPLMPGVTAQECDLAELLAQAQGAGASFAEARFRLAGPRRRGELARRLRQGYPRVAARLEVWERTACRAPEEERSRIEALFHALRRRVGLRSACDALGDDGPVSGGGGQRQFYFTGLDTQARGGRLQGKVRLGLGGLSPW
jgi:DNA repair photolyase